MMEFGVFSLVTIALAGFMEFLGGAGQAQEQTTTTTSRPLPEFCSRDSVVNGNPAPLNQEDFKLKKEISVNYILFVGKCPLHKISLSVPENSTFLDVMKQAAYYDDNFHFCADVYSFGYYITSISGLKEQKETKWHWLYYILKEEPNDELMLTKDKLAQIGVQGYIPSDGEYIVFSFNKLRNYDIF